MYDEYFKDATITFASPIQQVKTILEEYKTIYQEEDLQEQWFTKIKELCTKLNYATDMKAYKENPEKYLGSIVDVTNIIRVALTSLTTTPDLYSIMKILGKEKVLARIEKILVK